jgi:hypothetical protein
MSHVFDRSAPRIVFVQKRAETSRQAALIGMLQEAPGKLYATIIEDSEQLLLRGMPAGEVRMLQGISKTVVDKLSRGLGRATNTRCGREPRSLKYFVECTLNHIWGSVFLTNAMKLRDPNSPPENPITGSQLLQAIQLTEAVGGPQPGDPQKIRVLILGVRALVTGDAHFCECPTHRTPYLVLKTPEMVAGRRVRGGDCPLCEHEKERRQAIRRAERKQAPRDLGAVQITQQNPVSEPLDLTALE